MSSGEAIKTITQALNRQLPELKGKIAFKINEISNTTYRAEYMFTADLDDMLKEKAKTVIRNAANETGLMMVNSSTKRL